MGMKLEDVFPVVGTKTDLQKAKETRDKGAMDETMMDDLHFKIHVLGLIPSGDKSKGV